MKERPILFKGEMVRALLNGTKTQTRRIMKPQPVRIGNSTILQYRGGMYQPEKLPLNSNLFDLCPYGNKGDRLWVRETFGYVSPDENQCLIEECNIEYRADLHPNNDDAPGGWPKEEVAGLPNYPRWRPSIHMPRATSRILLEIVSVRVERLNDCSDADAIAEGCARNHNGYYWGGPHRESGTKQMATARQAYRDLWESINGAGSWALNPWVWVVTFRRIEP